MATGDEHIKAELKELAPELARLMENNPFLLSENYFEGKAEELSSIARFQSIIDDAATKSAFLLPKSYFEDLHEKVLDRLEFEEEMSGEKPADVPDNYFDAFPEKVMARIKSEEAQPQATTAKMAWLTWPRAVAIAAAFAGVVITLTIFTLLNRSATSNQLSDIEKVPTTDLQVFVENNLQSISSENLGNVLPVGDFTLEETELSNEKIKTDELREFLQEDIDLSTIEDML